jgi:hypothetical protein
MTFAPRVRRVRGRPKNAARRSRGPRRCLAICAPIAFHTPGGQNANVTLGQIVMCVSSITLRRCDSAARRIGSDSARKNAWGLVVCTARVRRGQHRVGLVYRQFDGAESPDSTRKDSTDWISCSSASGTIPAPPRSPRSPWGPRSPRGPRATTFGFGPLGIPTNRLLQLWAVSLLASGLVASEELALRALNPASHPRRKVVGQLANRVDLGGECLEPLDLGGGSFVFGHFPLNVG